MSNVKRDELIAKLNEYVALLEKEIASNVAFLNQNNKPVSPADLAKATELKASIVALKEEVK